MAFLSSREEPDISLSIVNSKACLTFFILHVTCIIISPKCGSALNTRRNDFICRCIERMTSHEEISLQESLRGDGSVAGGDRVDVPKFHPWGKCTMPLMNINSDWMSNASSGLCTTLAIHITRVLYFASWGVNIYAYL